jgi:hypothetical protein
MMKTVLGNENVTFHTCTVQKAVAVEYNVERIPLSRSKNSHVASEYITVTIVLNVAVKAGLLDVGNDRSGRQGILKTTTRCTMRRALQQ